MRRFNEYTDFDCCSLPQKIKQILGRDTQYTCIWWLVHTAASNHICIIHLVLAAKYRSILDWYGSNIPALSLRHWPLNLPRCKENYQSLWVSLQEMSDFGLPMLWTMTYESMSRGGNRWPNKNSSRDVRHGKSSQDHVWSLEWIFRGYLHMFFNELRLLDRSSVRTKK